MRKFIVFLSIVSLIISLTAPAGAVFADTDRETEVVESVFLDSTGGEVLSNEEDLSASSKESSSVANVGKVNPGQSADDSTAVDPDGVVAVPAERLANNIVITEIQTRGSSGASSELVELYNPVSTEVDVTGWCLKYASATGVSYANLACIKASDTLPSTRVVLGPDSYMVFATSDRAGSSFMPDVLFSGTMADVGGRLRLEDNNKEVIDLVGWGNKSIEFAGSAPAPEVPASMPYRSLQRVMVSDNYQDTPDNKLDFELQIAKTFYQTGALSEVSDVCLNIVGIQISSPSGYYINKKGDCIDKSTVNFCPGVIINEIGANLVRQFVELVNTGSDSVALDGCHLMTNRSSTAFELLSSAETIAPGGTYVVYIADTSLKLTKTTTGTVYLLASDGETEVDSRYYEDLSAETSWARFNNGWRQTFSVTPGLGNIYEEFMSCEAGYIRNSETGRCNKTIEPIVLSDCGEGRERNPVTGRCRNISTVSALTPCKEGQYRSEETNRCRSIVTTVASALKPCADGQFRNPETNRCKKIASTDDALFADCGEGRERNPETNRCRNVLASTTTKLPFSPEKAVTETAGSMIGWWALGGVSLVAIGYAGWQWRWEVSRLVERARLAFTTKGK